MPEGISQIENEPIKVEIIRDNGPEDFEGSRRGFEIFSQFLYKLEEDYPADIFPDNIAVAYLFDRVNKNHLTTFVAKNNKEITGVAIGKQDGDTFSGDWLIVAPRYQDGKTASEIMNIVLKEFAEIRLIASVYPNSKTLRNQQEISRQNALVRYYKRLGFEIDEERKPDYYRAPGDAVPMIRTRKSR